MTQPQPGEWWRTRGGEIRKVIHRIDGDDQYPIIAVNKGGLITRHAADGCYTNELLNLVEHLPDCDSFDWVPPRYPRYWETHDRTYYAYLRQDSATELVWVENDGEELPPVCVTVTGRVELTEADAMARLEPSPPDPGEGWRLVDKAVDVPQDGDEFWDREHCEWMPRLRAYRDSPFSEISIFYRRRIEPPKPRTRTVVLREYASRDEAGRWGFQWNDQPWLNTYPTGETRTI